MDKAAIPRREAITQSVSTMNTDMKEKANRKDCAAIKQQQRDV